MSYARYFLVPATDAWLVTLEGQIMGRYPTRSEALDAAIVMANLMGAMQHDADVMLQAEPDAPLELAWTYGIDKVLTQRVRSASKRVGGGVATAFVKRVKRIQRGAAAA